MCEKEEEQGRGSKLVDGRREFVRCGMSALRVWPNAWASLGYMYLGGKEGRFGVHAAI
jgi:hypothetical protein